MVRLYEETFSSWLASVAFICLVTLLGRAASLAVPKKVGISPGTGLRSTNKSSKWDFPIEVLIFEHTEHGSGGLVLNQPTPVFLRDLPFARFRGTFGRNALMLGCGLQPDVSTGDSGTSTVAVREMSPWFWITDLEDLHGQTRLEGAQDPLYMGGNIEDAALRIEQGNLDPEV
ncbi:unnamed protein product, partial [Heterosigma akashiwo]